MNSQRINKVLPNHGICSRRQVDIMILESRFLVNGFLEFIEMKLNSNFAIILFGNINEGKLNLIENNKFENMQ